LLSLAICKPKIRKAAGKNSFIFGFGAQHYKESLIYIAKVTAKPKIGDYYRKIKYARRPDCIYFDISGEPHRKRNARYHSKTDQRKKDVGLNFENAYVLLSKNFRYFGKRGTTEYKYRFPAIKKLVENLTQGHRVNHSQKLRKELLGFAKENWRKHPRKVNGTPNDLDKSSICNSDLPSCSVR
jgi:putative DNA base modification enzyme with NMAD domain